MDRSTGCWLWKSVPTSGGRGNYQPRRGLQLATHRLAYELTRGDPGRLFVLHTCDNGLCCNPEHLFLGTQQVNMDDKVSKGRQAKGSTHGRSISQDIIDRVKKWNGILTPTECSRVEKVPRQTVIRIFSGQHWSDK